MTTCLSTHLLIDMGLASNPGLSYGEYLRRYIVVYNGIHWPLCSAVEQNCTPSCRPENQT